MFIILDIVSRRRLIRWNVRWKKIKPFATAHMSHVPENTNAVTVFTTTGVIKNYPHVFLIKTRSAPTTAL